MKHLKLTKHMQLFVVMFLFGICAFAQSYESKTREYDASLDVSSVFSLQADLNGGIIGSVNESLGGKIDVFVVDTVRNTILYEMHLDHTSTTYEGLSVVHDDPVWSEEFMYSPPTWDSKDIKSSALGVDKYNHGNNSDSPYSLLQEPIGVKVIVILHHATFSSIKIPGIENNITLPNFNIEPPEIAVNPLFPPDHFCADLEVASFCPCNVWQTIKSPNTSIGSDLIIAAHRGLWGGNLGYGDQENSRRAIQNAYLQTPIVEVDVMKTQDNMLILSHDYNINRLSDYSGQNPAYLFDLNYSSIRYLKLRKRNGSIPPDGNMAKNMENYYLRFASLLSILKRSDMVVLIDIKGLLRKNTAGGGCINCDYDPTTTAGQQSILNSWAEIFKKCYTQAASLDMLSYIAFKIPYTYSEIKTATGLSDEKLERVLFMPMIQPDASANALSNACTFIDSWINSAESSVLAIETNFKLLSDPYLQSFVRNNVTYDNLLHYVSSKGFRPGIFSEEPVGPKGVVNRWAEWSMKNVDQDIRGDHFGLMSVPYFSTAVITTDRPDVWQQIKSAFSSQPQQTMSFVGSESDITKIDQIIIDDNISINANYDASSIIIRGLEKIDLESGILLYNLQGHLMLQEKIKTEPSMVIPTELPQGIYLLKIVGERQKTIKLIIN
ncbi:glycerophosphodiester phosphodiesterase family protein [Viscerimonas tarda]|nr:hypothetical protein FACS189413_13450 [Bacteroidia bacterium]